jgi:hypothetical protein
MVAMVVPAAATALAAAIGSLVAPGATAVLASRPTAAGSTRPAAAYISRTRELAATQRAVARGALAALAASAVRAPLARMVLEAWTRLAPAFMVESVVTAETAEMVAAARPAAEGEREAMHMEAEFTWLRAPRRTGAGLSTAILRWVEMAVTVALAGGVAPEVLAAWAAPEAPAVAAVKDSVPSVARAAMVVPAVAEAAEVKGAAVRTAAPAVSAVPPRAVAFTWRSGAWISWGPNSKGTPRTEGKEGPAGTWAMEARAALGRLVGAAVMGGKEPKAPSVGLVGRTAMAAMVVLAAEPGSAALGVWVA